MENKISIKIINLLHRTDRRESSIQELKKLEINCDEDKFFHAKHTPNFGALGCALSHAMVITNFLYYDDKPYLLILEDDFEIRDIFSFRKNLFDLTTSNFSWDVFLLGHNQAVPVEVTPILNIFRVINAQTTSGYLVHRNFAPKLVEIFLRSANGLQQYAKLPVVNQKLAHHFFSCDILWKELQTQSKFIASIPSLITQRESFSDIQLTRTDYGV